MRSLRSGAALLGAMLLVGCASQAATPTPSPAITVAPAPSAAPASPGPSAAASPGASAAASPSASEPIPVNPDRTLPPGMSIWPPTVTNALIALAAADNQFKLAADDWATGAQNQDLELLLAAAQGMAFLADESLPNAERLIAFPDTTAVATELVGAYQAISEHGRAVAAAAVAGDTPGFEAAVTGLGAAMAAYGRARPGLMDRTELGLIMRRGLLVK